MRIDALSQLHQRRPSLLRYLSRRFLQHPRDRLHVLEVDFAGHKGAADFGQPVELSSDPDLLRGGVRREADFNAQPGASGTGVERCEAVCAI